MDIALTILIIIFVTFFTGFIISKPFHLYLMRYGVPRTNGMKKGLVTSADATEFNRLHGGEGGRVPRGGGILIGIPLVIASLFTALYFGLISDEFILLYIAWYIGFMVGILFDAYEVIGRPYPVLKRILIVTFCAIGIGTALIVSGVSSLFIPFIGFVEFGFWILVPIILVFLALFAAGIIDGIDGLSGGVWTIILITYAVYAFSLSGFFSISLFLIILIASIVPFLIGNLYPAKWYGSDSMMLPFAFVLGTAAFLTDAVVGGAGVTLLIISGVMLVVTVLSVILQSLSKLILKRKIWRSTPIHHHFEAIGIPSQSVVEMYWYITILASFLGLLLFNI